MELSAFLRLEGEKQFLKFQISKPCSTFSFKPQKSIHQNKFKFLPHIINYFIFLVYYMYLKIKLHQNNRVIDIPKLFSTLKEWLNRSSTLLELQLEQVCSQNAVLRKANENPVGGGSSFFKSPIYNYLKNHSMKRGANSNDISPREL